MKLTGKNLWGLWGQAVLHSDSGDKIVVILQILQVLSLQPSGYHKGH